MPIIIRPMQLADEEAVSEICYVTSPWGKDGKESLRRLVALRWAYHYIQYETSHCHVAVDTEANDAVVGYLLCAPDTRTQEWNFQRLTLPLIKEEIKRLQPLPGLDRLKLQKEFFFTPTEMLGLVVRKIMLEHPAHIHIDINPAYHRRGIGRMLFAAHEAHLRSIACPGYHLIVGSKNAQAVFFYTAMQMQDRAHVGGPFNFGIVFTKKL